MRTFILLVVIYRLRFNASSANWTGRAKRNERDLSATARSMSSTRSSESAIRSRNSRGAFRHISPPTVLHAAKGLAMSDNATNGLRGSGSVLRESECR